MHNNNLLVPALTQKIIKTYNWIHKNNKIKIMKNIIKALEIEISHMGIILIKL